MGQVVWAQRRLVMHKKIQAMQLGLQLPIESPVRLEPEVERELIRALAELLLAVARGPKGAMEDEANE
jgi:hypothetical protein